MKSLGGAGRGFDPRLQPPLRDQSYGWQAKLPRSSNFRLASLAISPCGAEVALHRLGGGGFIDLVRRV